MALILAIEPDQRQAVQLAGIARHRLNAELVLADTTERALDAIGDRVPDLVLVPALLSPQDDAALAAALRVIAAAANVRTLTIPVLASGAPRKASRAVLGRWRKTPASTAPEGCDPAVFAEQVSTYLAETIAERAAHEPDPATYERATETAPFVPNFVFDPVPQPGVTPAPAFQSAVEAEPLPIVVAPAAFAPVEERAPIVFETPVEQYVPVVFETPVEAIASTVFEAPVERLIDPAIAFGPSPVAAAPEPAAAIVVESVVPSAHEPVAAFAAQDVAAPVPEAVSAPIQEAFVEPVVDLEPAPAVAFEPLASHVDVPVEPVIAESPVEPVLAEFPALNDVEAVVEEAASEPETVPVLAFPVPVARLEETIDPVMFAEPIAQNIEEDGAEQATSEQEPASILAFRPAFAHVEEPVVIDLSSSSFDEDFALPEAAASTERAGFEASDIIEIDLSDETLEAAATPDEELLEEPVFELDMDDAAAFVVQAPVSVYQRPAMAAAAPETPFAEAVFEPLRPASDLELWMPLTFTAARVWPSIEGVASEYVDLSVEMFSPPAPAKVERTEWTELIASLRQDMERRRETPEPTPITSVASRRKSKPVQDEWGFFDPQQCGFAALLAKLDEITDASEEPASRLA
jgi:hypothetical protein